MNYLGVIEGFFGPQWPDEDRKSYAAFLSQYGGNFYIYAPKQDPHLRKQWRAPWDSSYLTHISALADAFHQHGIKFGVGFSPFGLGSTLVDEEKKNLKEKLKLIEGLGIDMLGLFFDDMPVTENLAQTQVEVLSIIRQNFKGKIIFCPSYYTPDPLLDRVFGQRPEHYLDDIGDLVPSDVSIAWTGPKVISPVIDKEHMLETTALLKRKPFIWENLFANDGPKNCKFLKLKPFAGRSQDVFQASEAFAFNMMNQPQLSKIVYLSSKYVLEGTVEPDQAFEKALENLCSPAFKDFILKYKDSFLTKGLDFISSEDKKLFLAELAGFQEPAATEIADWLEGKYNVGSECLTD